MPRFSGAPIGSLHPRLAHLFLLRLSFQKGFSLLEVMVALAVAMIFVTVTLQMFVSAAFLRSKGDQYDQAYNWIQEDYERVFTKANQYQANAVPASELCAATTPAGGLAASFLNDATLGLGGANAIIGQKTFGGHSFTLSRTADYATSPDPYKSLTITYSVTPTNGGNMSASTVSGSNAIAAINTEVVIYAGFKCP
jgi:prepilin-type N-terminal cleavage/methylation domain-containing protein